MENHSFEDYWNETENLLSSSSKKYPIMVHESSSSKMMINTQFEKNDENDIFHENSPSYLLNGVELTKTQILQEIEIISKTCTMPDNCLHLVIKSSSSSS